MSGIVYLDTSALVTLALREGGHDDVRELLAGYEGFVASELLRVEAGRVGLRYDDAARAVIDRALAGVALLPLDAATLRTAATLTPESMRSLDAIHLATALAIRDDIAALCTLDARLARAARAHDLTVVPSAP